MTSSFFNPVNIFFGQNALTHLPKLLKKSAILCVCSAGGAGRGYIDLIRSKHENISLVVQNVPSHADISYLEETHLSLNHKEFDQIVAIGGGSVLDTAKVLAADCPTEQLLLAIKSQSAEPTINFKRVIAIPTTAGSGSDLTPWATIWDRDDSKKYSLQSSELFPKATLVIPELTQTLRKQTRIESACDALSHAFESLWNKNSNPTSTSLAVSAIALIISNLPELLKEPDNRDCLEKMSLAALQAGLAFSNTKTAIAHSLSYYLTLTHQTSHGLACSFSLPAILKYVTEQNPDFSQILPLGDQPVRTLTKFFEDIGVSNDIADFGVKSSEKAAVIDFLGDNPRTSNFCYDPQVLIDQVFAF